jgi:hypothetical protein
MTTQLRLDPTACTGHGPCAGHHGHPARPAPRTDTSEDWR